MNVVFDRDLSMIGRISNIKMTREKMVLAFEGMSVLMVWVKSERTGLGVLEGGGKIPRAIVERNGFCVFA